MSALPWVRFFPSDWLGGTRGMSAAEMGVYISLISMMYDRGEPIAEDHPRLARLCGASNSQFKKALEGLLRDGKITRKDGGLWNDRVEKEQVYRSEKSTVGKRAAEQRWQKSEQNQYQADASALRSQCQGNANQKPEPSKEPNGSSDGSAPAALTRSKKSSSKVGDRIAAKASLEAMGILDAEHVEMLIRHRERMGVPLDGASSTTLGTKIARWFDPNEAVDEMLANGWRGFEPDWLAKRKGLRLVHGKPHPPPSNDRPSVRSAMKDLLEGASDDRNPPPPHDDYGFDGPTLEGEFVAFGGRRRP